MPNLVNKNQSAYINNRFISEGRKLILDVVEITDLLQVDWLLMTIDIEKIFDSVNYFFLKICSKTMQFWRGIFKMDQNVT